MAEVKIRGISKAYTAGVPVLKGVDLDIHAGELFFMLGPSGCGKSTLLKNLNRNLQPEHGCVMVCGDDIATMKKKDIARKVSVVPQSNEIKFAFTAREIVEMGRMPFQEMFMNSGADDFEKNDDRTYTLWITIKENLTSTSEKEIAGMVTVASKEKDDNGDPVEIYEVPVGPEVVANNVQFVESKRDGAGNVGNAAPSAPASFSNTDASDFAEITGDDDLPF